LGKLTITKKQAESLGVEPYTRYSPMLEKCCLLLSANESYQNAEKDLLLLTGIRVGHSTCQRKVVQKEFILPDVKQELSEVSIDGGSIRIRSNNKGEKSYWKQYKTARLQGIHYGAFFEDNLSLTDWINSQNMTNPIYCLGDGHDGIWNIIAEIGDKTDRIEILDWYHLMENLYKIEIKINHLKQLKAYLWFGEVNKAINYLNQLRPIGYSNFCKYLNKHQTRIINYHYFQWQQICSIGSGAVESAVKQIGHRVKITGAQWKKENVSQILQLRTCYLNGQLAVL